MADIVETAHAKINLALHVTGQRSDGYHLIESLVVFAQMGDRLSLRLDTEDRFSVSGWYADNLTSDNLVLHARDALRKSAARRGKAMSPVAIHLEKNIPVAAGLGGGSADAAACLRGLSRLWKLPGSATDLAAIGLQLGADVPMCLMSRSLVAQGIGDELTRLEALPSLAIVLVNPHVAISTPQVFGKLQNKDNPQMSVPVARTTGSLVRELALLRNDLQSPAISIVPVVANVMDAIDSSGAMLARMSGSGATCFGIYPDIEKAAHAAKFLSAEHPAWYVCTSETRPD